MPTSFFGPANNHSPQATDLFSLPFNWMTTACMESSFRRFSGWLGLAPVASVSRAFTCRIASRPGIYGVLPVSAEPGNVGSAVFRLFYFPTSGDPLIDHVSLPAAVVMESTDAVSRIRDFPAHPDLCGLFGLGELRLSLTYPARGIALSLTSSTRSCTVVPAGLRAPDGVWVIPPGGLEEDLPTFDIARDLFRVLAAGIAASLGKAPEVLAATETPAMQRFRKIDGTLEVRPFRDAVVRTEALAWDEAALSPWLPLPLSVDADQYQIVRVVCGDEASNANESNPINKPSLIVLSGFLGAGKTTFLNQFIEFHLAHDRLVAVIQNEIGETGVDANLLEGEDSVLALDAGCVCCSLTGSLTRGVRKLNSTLSPEFIVLETTGLANPMNMIEEFSEIGDLVELSAVVAIVDASRHRENIAASDVAEQQILAADVVVLNKCDLASDADRVEIESEIRALNPQAKIVFSTNGRVNPSLIAGGLSRHVKNACSAHRSRDCDGTHYAHGVTHQDEGFAALRFRLADCIQREELMRVLARSPTDVLRVKGIARFDDTGEPQIIQYVPGYADCQPAAKDVQDEPFVLVIGRNLDATSLRELWRPLMEEDATA